MVSIVGSDKMVSIVGSDKMVSIVGSDKMVSIVGSDTMVSIVGSDKMVRLATGGWTCLKSQQPLAHSGRLIEHSAQQDKPFTRPT